MNNEQVQKIRLIVLLSICILNLLYMHNYIILTCQVEDVVEWTSWVDNFCRVCFDVWCVFTLFYFLTRGRSSHSIIITFYITLLWAFANIVYSRFFHNYVSLSTIGLMDAIANPLVYNSVINGLALIDLYFVLIPIVFHYVFNKTNVKICFRSYFKRSFTVFFSLLIMNLLAHMLFCFINPSLRYLNYYERRVGVRMFGQNFILAVPKYANFHNGSIKSLAIESVLVLQGRTSLSKDQRILIENELNHSRKTLTNDVGPKVNNVIFILVESYMSFVTEMMVDSLEVTPFFNSLKQDSTVYYNGRVRSNITMGESSDGQYILMTGMLPLRSIITVSKACRKPLPSLAKSLQALGIKKSRMILPTPSSIWRQDDMCKQYGFTNLYDCEDYLGEHEQTLTDKQVFELAEQKDLEFKKEKFFSMILTATMHQPYNKIVDSTFVVKDLSLNSEMKSYINLCHYTDKCVGDYMETLKRNGLYDNSLIIITADHNAHNTDFDKSLSSDIPLFIVNGNIDINAYHGPCNQLDIYTTIIDVLGIKNEWTGLGISLMNESYVDSVTPLKWEVSEMMLLSDYFE